MYLVIRRARTDRDGILEDDASADDDVTATASRYDGPRELRDNDVFTVVGTAVNTAVLAAVEDDPSFTDGNDDDAIDDNDDDDDDDGIDTPVQSDGRC